MPIIQKGTFSNAKIKGESSDMVVSITTTS